MKGRKKEKYVWLGNVRLCWIDYIVGFSFTILSCKVVWFILASMERLQKGDPLTAFLRILLPRRFTSDIILYNIIVFSLCWWRWYDLRKRAAKVTGVGVEAVNPWRNWSVWGREALQGGSEQLLRTIVESMFVSSCGYDKIKRYGLAASRNSTLLSSMITERSSVSNQ